MLRHPVRLRRDDGFTLPELLITITILGVIIVPLTGLVISYLMNSATIRARLTESKDQQIASQFWSTDVDSVGQRDASTFAASNGINTGTCGTPPAGGTTQISFQWTSFSFTSASPPVISSTTTTVTYYSTPSTSTTPGKLIRTSCASGTPRSVTVANTVLIDATHPISCSKDDSTYVACSTLSGTGGTGVYLRFFSKDPSGKGQAYWTTLRGQRRQTL